MIFCLKSWVEKVHILYGEPVVKIIITRASTDLKLFSFKVRSLLDRIIDEIVNVEVADERCDEVMRNAVFI